MKFSFISVLFFVTQAIALDVGGGIRETFVTKDFFVFGGDSTFRIRRNLHDRKFSSFFINTKIVAAQNNPSYLYRLQLSTGPREMEVMVQQITQGGRKAIIKPQLVMEGSYEHISLTELGEGLNHSMLLHTYQKEMGIYVNLTKHVMVEELIIGSGVNTLYIDKTKSNDIDSFHRYIRLKLNPRTKLALNVTSLRLLNILSRNPAHAKAVGSGIDKVYYNINSLGLETLTEKDSDYGQLKIQLEELYQRHLAVFPQKEFAISDVFLPLCEDGVYQGLNYLCDQGRKGTEKLQIFKRFGNLISSMVSSGMKIASLELILGVTDFEPDSPRPEYFLYDQAFKSVDVEKIFSLNSESKRLLEPIEEVEYYTKQACIYFDTGDTPDKKDMIGRVHAQTMVSLLGAFREYGVRKKSIDQYQAGELFDCDKAFYIASNFLTEVPTSFQKDLADYIKTNNFFWFNYKFESFNQSLADPLAFSVPYIIPADTPPTKENPDVGFFQLFDYKGETFHKDSNWNPIANNFTSSPELNFVDIKNPSQVEVLAWARHNKTDQKVPYVVKQAISGGSIWYVADSPLSFVHYEDRYLILTDLMWDFLEVAPPEGPPKAMVRIEDVNPSLDLAGLNWAMGYMASENVPFSLALVPYFSDLLGVTGVENHKPVFKPITKYKSFVGSMRYAKSLNADIVYHGVAHQVDDLISGYDGVTGSDYEFWLYPENTPIPYDSVDWVMDRLELGEKVLKELDLIPIAWEIPHYAASVLDYYIFAKVFEWTYHRSVLFHHKVIQNTALPEKYRMFECDSIQCREDRRALLRNIKVEADYSTFGASLFPYPIYKDSYGQKVMPETLGMVDFPFYSKQTWRPVSTPQDILNRAKKLKVIRGAIGAFFWHTHVLSRDLYYYQQNPGSFESYGGKKSLKIIIEGMRDLGYEFISISDCKYFPRKGCEV